MADKRGRPSTTERINRLDSDMSEIKQMLAQLLGNEEESEEEESEEETSGDPIARLKAQAGKKAGKGAPAKRSTVEAHGLKWLHPTRGSNPPEDCKILRALPVVTPRGEQSDTRCYLVPVASDGKTCGKPTEEMRDLFRAIESRFLPSITHDKKSGEPLEKPLPPRYNVSFLMLERTEEGQALRKLIK